MIVLGEHQVQVINLHKVKKADTILYWLDTPIYFTPIKSFFEIIWFTFHQLNSISFLEFLWNDLMSRLDALHLLLLFIPS